MACAPSVAGNSAHVLNDVPVVMVVIEPLFVWRPEAVQAFVIVVFVYLCLPVFCAA